MALITSVSLALTATLTKTPGVTQPAAPAVVSRLLSLLSGTAAGQADKLYAATRQIAASSNDDLDLAGVLTDDFGASITFARVKLLYVGAAAGNTNNVVVGAAAANPWVTLLNSTGTCTLRPDAFLLGAAGKADATGYAVTAGTGDILRVANSAGGSVVNYDIVIVGASA